MGTATKLDRANKAEVHSSLAAPNASTRGNIHLDRALGHLYVKAGSTWYGTNAHNSGTGIQGGSLTERYHTTSTQYTILTNYTDNGDLSSTGQDLTITPAAGAYSANIDLTSCTGSSDGFQINNGSNYAKFLYKGINTIDVEWAVDEIDLTFDALIMDFADAEITMSGDLDVTCNKLLFESADNIEIEMEIQSADINHHKIEFEIDVVPGHATADKTLDFVVNYEGTKQFGVIADTDGSASYKEVAALMPFYQGGYGNVWESLPTVTPQSLQEGGLYVAQNNSSGEPAIVIYTDIEGSPQWIPVSAYSLRNSAFAIDSSNIATLLSADGSDEIQIYHDNTHAYIKTNDGQLRIETNEGANTNTTLEIRGKGTGYGILRTQDEANDEYLELSCQLGVGYIATRGAGGSHLQLQAAAHADVILFSSAAEGETRQLKIRGHRNLGSLGSLEIGVGIDAFETASFDGVGNYLFDGILQSNKGSDLASANDVAVPAGNYCDVTGTTQINTMAITNIQSGTFITLQFDASVTVKHATAGAGAQFQLSGAGDFSATAGDTLTVVYDGTYWREVSKAVI